MKKNSARQRSNRWNACGRQDRATRNKPTMTLDFDKSGGLIPAIAQDEGTGEVLMLAYMNREAWETTLKTGRATYYSRSRRTLWIKGKTSGHLQLVKEIRIDCDADTVLLKVEQVGGAACHTGHRSCFHLKVVDDTGTTAVIGDPVFDPEEVYGK
ncbi:MAG: phosphoribosyl-AMP cyclohydrolase [Desulfobacterales bacterium]